MSETEKLMAAMSVSQKPEAPKMFTVVVIMNDKFIKQSKELKDMMLGDRVAISCHYRGQSGYAEYVRVSDNMFVSSTTTSVISTGKMASAELLATTAFTKLFDNLCASDLQISHTLTVAMALKPYVVTKCPAVSRKMIVLPESGHDGYILDS